jgi:PAS domain-containing protein
MTKNTLCLLICENYKREADAVMKAGNFSDVKIHTYPAVCYSSPKSKKPLSDHIPSGRNRFGRIAFVGSHCAKFFQLPSEETAEFRSYLSRQCFHLFVNRDIVDRYLDEGSSLQTPGFLERWRQCIKERGLDQRSARKFFKKSADGLVLLDTGVLKNATKKLKEFAGFLNMPFESLPVGLDHFHVYLKGIILEWRLENEKVVATEKVRAGEDRLDALLNSITDAAILLDSRHRIVLTNSAFTKMFGYRTREIAGKPPERLYADKPIGESGTSCRDKDGAAFTVEIVETSMQDRQGATTGFLRTFRRITERKKDEEQPGAAMVRRSDRREHERFMIGRTCLVEINDSEMVELKDISLSGVRLSIPGQVPVKNNYSVKIFPSIKKEIQLSGTVVWSSPKESSAEKPVYEAGLKFSQLDENTSSSLKQFVTSLAF